MTSHKSQKAGPVLIELDETASETLTPATAPVIIDEPEAQGQAMQSVMALATARRSWLARLFWSSLIALISFAASVATWTFVTDLITRNTILGTIAMILTATFVIVLLMIAAKEWLALGRLKAIDQIREDAETGLLSGDLKISKDVCERLLDLYGARPELKTECSILRSRLPDSFDADGVLIAAEQHLLTSLDAQARIQIEAAARQVATVTAIVPLALADLIVAFTANLRMIRRIAEIYGGRGGTLGSWRLTKTVLTHLAATGAVAVGDDLLGSVAGGGMLSKLSRRFGEGVINGALTARVGMTAIEICRPLPYINSHKVSVSTIIRRALTGLFTNKS